MKTETGGNNSRLDVTLSNQIMIRVTHLTPWRILNDLRAALTFDNPQYLENQKYSRYNGQTPKFLCFFEQSIDKDVAWLPRGVMGIVASITARYNTPISLGYDINVCGRLKCSAPKQIDALRPYQKEAVTAVIDESSYGGSVLCAPTGSGKTVMALHIIAERAVPTLIVVHTKALLQQWVEAIKNTFSYNEDMIGVIGGGKYSVKQITVGVVNSLKTKAEGIQHMFGQVIIDECHHTPATIFTDVLSHFKCQYRLGLTATPIRRDGLDNLIYWNIGPLAHTVDTTLMQKGGYIMTAKVKKRLTNIPFDFSDDKEAGHSYSNMLTDIGESEPRNALIVADITQEVRRLNASDMKGHVLIVSDRKRHCKTMALDTEIALQDNGISPLIAKVMFWTSATPPATIEKYKKMFNTPGTICVIHATSGVIGEGFDLPGVAVLFLATPVKYAGKLTQLIGRAVRPSPGKGTPIIYDYVDDVGILHASWASRQKVYTALNMKVIK